MTDHNKEFVDCWPAIEILNERLAEYETNPSPQLRIDILDTIGDLAAIRIELDAQIEHAELVLDGNLKPMNRVTTARLKLLRAWL